MTYKGTILICSCHSMSTVPYFPNNTKVWDGWKFIFDDPAAKLVDNTPYDYLVMIDDHYRSISLQCPPHNTLHLSTEPRHYHPAFTRQFAICLTVDPNIDHPHAIMTQPGFGWGSSQQSTFESTLALFDTPKPKVLSVVSSSNYAARLNFARKLKAHFGTTLDYFGRGIRAFEDKLQTVQDYRFHIVLENCSMKHYYTEKLVEAIINGCYPLYYGCSNLDEYIPANSFSPIDIHDVAGSIRTIEHAIAEGYDRTHRSALREARDRILYQYTHFIMLTRFIEAHQRGKYNPIESPVHLDQQIFPHNQVTKSLGAGKIDASYLRISYTTAYSRLSTTIDFMYLRLHSTLSAHTIGKIIMKLLSPIRKIIIFCIHLPRRYGRLIAIIRIRQLLWRCDRRSANTKG